MAAERRVKQIRAILDGAGVGAESRRTFIGALEHYLTLQTDSLPLNLSAAESQAWTQALNLIAQLVDSPNQAKGSAPPPPPKTYAVRMKRREYNRLQALMAERRQANAAPEPDSLDEVPFEDDASRSGADAQRAAGGAAEEAAEDASIPIDDGSGSSGGEIRREEDPVQPDPLLIDDGIVSESGDGFLDSLTPEQLAALDASDGLVIVRKRR